ncbi:DUF4783 domain-containing protein [candidate division KSB1 bacterium]
MKVQKNTAISLIILLIILIGNNLSAQDEVISLISKTISSGNSKELAKYFSTAIDLTVPGYEGSFSKIQAEQIMKDFFEKNVPKSFKVNHQGSSKDGSRFAVGTLISSNNETYRTYFLLKKTKDKYNIQQFQIEAD